MKLIKTHQPPSTFNCTAEQEKSTNNKERSVKKMTKEEIKQELEKQLQLLSKLSENKNLDIDGKIIEICNALAFFC